MNSNIFWLQVLNSNRIRKSTRVQGIHAKRNEFESDYGRIVFSPAVRRMHDKTQIFPLTTDDNVHTRLTHSLEVQSIARYMATIICLDERFTERFDWPETDLNRTIRSILSSTALCHDIGNPPFGHYGEVAIQNYFKEYFDKNKELDLSLEEKNDFLKFDGNAQGFRIITKLQTLWDTNGLNLTCGTLAAFLKYPFKTNDQLDDADAIFYRNKLGVFQSESNVLQWIRETSKLDRKRHPLAFLMEAADTICYLTMDPEDGINKRYYNIEFLLNWLLEDSGYDLGAILEDFEKEYSKLKEEEGIPEDFIEVSRTVRFRIFAMRRLVDHAAEDFLENISEIEDGTYLKELIKNEDCPLAMALDEFCKRVIFPEKDIVTLELTGESALRGLFNHFVHTLINYTKTKKRSKADKLYSIISPSIRRIAALENPGKDFPEYSDYRKLRMIVDYISGMTDFYAINVYQRLGGIKIA